MLDKYSDSQKLFYEYFNRINKDGHVSHAYLIECNGVSYSFNLALDLAKFFLCNGVYDEKICINHRDLLAGLLWCGAGSITRCYVKDHRR